MDANPYASPQSPEGDVSPFPGRMTRKHIAGLVAIGTSGGVLLGGLTNIVKGALSPEYFRDVMGWYYDARTIWLASVGQGMLEGAVYGLVYSVVFSSLISFVSNRQCSFGVAVRYGLVTLALAAAMWILGGACGVAWVLVLPDYSPPALFGYHESWFSRVAYAWVRGSIWGIVHGGLLCVVLVNLRYCLRGPGRYAQPPE